MHRGLSTSGLPPSDPTSTLETVDISSDTLGFHVLSPHYRPYLDANNDYDRHKADPDSKLDIEASFLHSVPQFRRDESREIGQSTRKRPRRSRSGSEGSEGVVAFINDDSLVRAGGRERLVTLSPSEVGTGSSVFRVPSKRKQPPIFLRLFLVAVWIPPPVPHFITSFPNAAG